MSIQRVTCYIVTCDECRTAFDETADYIVYFDSEDEAIRYVIEHGWVHHRDRQPDLPPLHRHRALPTRRPPLQRLDALRLPRRHPDHALFGCGLFRICWRDGCDTTKPEPSPHYRQPRNHHPRSLTATLTPGPDLPRAEGFRGWG